MITRRGFFTGTVATAVASLLGRRAHAAGGTQAGASLRLLFVGGTVFVDEKKKVFTALQLSGRGASHESHKLDHNSFMVGPPKTFTGGTSLSAHDAGVLAKQLGWPVRPYDSVCLAGKHITISGTNAPAITYQCQKVAEYGHIAQNWTRKSWTPGANNPVYSRFTLLNGYLRDGTAMNTNGAATKWYIKDKIREKFLSDVTELSLDGERIVVGGLNTGDLVLTAGQSLTVAVFAGPLHRHPAKHQYRKISHAILLKTIYDVGSTPDSDILPATDVDVIGMEGDEIKNPCGGDQPQIRVPPDSEYCVNYNDLP